MDYYNDLLQRAQEYREAQEEAMLEIMEEDEEKEVTIERNKKEGYTNPPFQQTPRIKLKEFFNDYDDEF